MLLKEIIENSCTNCWLPKNGMLPERKELKTGKLTFSEALHGFAAGRTVLVRHSEQNSEALAEIADDFKQHLGGEVDIQLYFTPTGEEGFNWHYDAEDVIVIQSFGAKEFYLLKNTVTERPYPKNADQSEDFKKEKMAPEIRCLLQAGDWLYIPAGYWHKAKAVSDSFHLSVGVMLNH
jgi:ribosomal protein L16 Arg81 hydroxylase